MRSFSGPGMSPFPALDVGPERATDAMERSDVSIDGFLTFLGLIAALIALAPEATRRGLFLRWQFNLGATVLAFGVILYLLLFDLIAPACGAGSLCAILELGEDRWIDPRDASFLVVLAWFGLVSLGLFWRRPLLTRHLSGLAALAAAFAAEKRFLELSQLIQPHLDLVAQAAGDSDPRHAKAHHAAKAIQRLLFERQDLVEFIALERPGLAIAMMDQKHHRVFGFADRALTLLAERPGSLLYTEIANNQTITGRGYLIRPENTYLSYLFGDARHADRLMAWQPVMDAALDRLEEARGEPYERFLNQKPVRFDDHRWRDPTFVAIRYLDLMVDAALRQNVPFHTSLLYVPQLSDRLIALYDDAGEGVDRDAETPNRAGYLIMTLVTATKDWIQAVVDLPTGAYHLKIETEQVTLQGDNIPKSAILTLGDVMADVLLAPNLGDGFKRHLAEVAFRLVRNLPGDGDRAVFRRALIQSLVHGGPHHRRGHLAELRRALNLEDPELRMRLADLSEAIEARLDYVCDKLA